MFLECVGSIDWWANWLQSEGVLHVNHSFQKQSALSQYVILGPNGPSTLSVPTRKKSRKGAYSDVLISNEEDWQGQHWKSIRTAYLKSPFFIYYDYKLEALYARPFERLMDFNKAYFEVLCSCLKVNTATWDEQQPVAFEGVPNANLDTYPQVFDAKNGFDPSAGILDLLFNLGPETKTYLLKRSRRNPSR